MSPTKHETLQNGTLRSKKYLIIIGALIVVAIAATLVTVISSTVSDKAVASDISQSSSAVMSLLSSYGDTTYLSNGTQGYCFPMIEPIVVETNDVKVTVREIVYDGIWLYTSADICSITPESVLVMPGSAAIVDSCSGLNGEQGIADKRSFKNAAIEDGKRLLAVYVYPKEFSSRFIVATVVVVLLMLLENVWEIRTAVYQSGYTVYYFFFNTIVFSGLLGTYGAPVACALPYCGELLQERIDGIHEQFVARVGFKQYYLSKFLTATVSSGI